MKKKIQSLAFLFVIVLGGYNFYSAQNVNVCSDLLLQEVGALASGDGNSCTCGTVTRDCE